MIRRINRIIFIFLVVAVALYVVIQNRESTTVLFGRGTSITANTGVILIATFGLGILCAALVSLFFGIKSYFRERKLHARERQRLAFYDGMVSARSASASGDWLKARLEWERLIARDPTNIIARLELSRCLEGLGEVREALQLLDEARAAEAHNTEVLFRAAELNIALGNRTAAIDNLALIMAHQPNRRAAALARDLSEQLGRIEDALEYQSRLEGLAPGEHQSEAVSRLQFHRIIRDHAADPASLREQLRAFTKKHPKYAPALERLAELEQLQGRTDEAAQLLVRSARSGGRPTAWAEAARLWLSTNNPERALAAARSATKDTTGAARIEAELNLIRVYLGVNMFEDARRALENVRGLAAAEQVEVSPALSQQILTLQGLCLSQLGQFRESAEVWRELSGEKPVALSNGSPPAGHEEAPAPRLSTP